jgi:hypothetical protein
MRWVVGGRWWEVGFVSSLYSGFEDEVRPPAGAERGFS